MLLADLIQLVKLGSGQYSVDLSDYISTTKGNEWLELIINHRVFPLLASYRPVHQTLNITATDSPYIFTGTAPERISNVVPGSVLGSVLNPLLALTEGLDEIKKPTLLWNYDKPNFYVQNAGDYTLTAIYGSPIISGEGTEADPKTIANLDEGAKEYLINLALGYFMISVGRKGRTAKLAELPIDIDLESLISEGDELVKETKEKLTTGGSKWFLGIP